MKQKLAIILLGAAIGIAIFLLNVDLDRLIGFVEDKYFPCMNPIGYAIGSFDTRFGISEKYFLNALAEAEAIWEKPAGKELFLQDPDGNLKINLIYDFRQEATQKLEQLGIVVGNDEASFNDLKSKYEIMQAAYERKKSDFESRVEEFNIRGSVYESAVTKENKRGGAQKDIYDQLDAERIWLNAEAAELNALQNELNAEVDDINALVVALNRLVVRLNLTVSQFNAIGQERGAEFEEGVYRSDSGGEAIDIYQFDTETRLIRVLAHELGHALGLPHVSDPKAIMYRLNESTSEKLAPADLEALNVRCSFE